MGDDVTVVVCFFKTPRLVERCVHSLRACYPDACLVLVDDGSRDEATEAARALCGDGRAELVVRPENGGHGAALNDGLARVQTRYAFTLDSDATVERCGFIELMRARFLLDPLLFAVGELVAVFDRPIYVRPRAMLLDVEKSREVAPFILHGAPALSVMAGAARRGWRVEDFPICDYVDQHGGSGTRKALRARLEGGGLDSREVARFQPRLRDQLRARGRRR